MLFTQERRRRGSQINGPSLVLPFALDKSLDPRITFTRASSGTYFDASGVLQTATTDEPRFDHNPVTGESLGLLAEGAATNLLTYSEDFSNAAWAKGNCTISANAITAPDGTLTGDKLIANSGAQANIDVGMVPGLANSTVYTLSVFAKAGEKNWLVVNLGSGLASRRNYFNLSSGVLGTIDGGITATIKDVGGGWYLCVASGVTSPANGSAAFAGFQWTDADGATAATGDGTSGIFIWGAQLETGSRASSSIKTEASTVTRAADSASMTGTNFSSWFNAAEGTFVVEFEAGGAGDEFPLAVGAINVNEMAPYRNNSANDMYLYVAASNVTQINLAIGDHPSSGPCKFAFSYGGAAVDASVDGAASVGATPITIPTVSALYIGARSGGENPLKGTIKRLTYYPRRLTNGNLQEITL